MGDISTVDHSEDLTEDHTVDHSEDLIEDHTDTVVDVTVADATVEDAMVEDATVMANSGENTVR